MMGYLELAQAYAKACRERDMALSQLADIGAGYAEKMTDFERVIRCKDCEYRNNERRDKFLARCELTDYFMPRYGYCSCGERRADNG